MSMKLSRPLKRRPADRSAELVDVGRRMAPQLAGPPAHIHAAHDETFVVLEGQLRFRIGDQFHTAVPGETVFA
ncbi:MAG: cupin domain-containing protein, partial [Pseudonocardiaceae bacterium]